MKGTPPDTRSYRHLIYAVISIACPFIAIGIAMIYQDYAYAWINEPKSVPVDDADINAGAMLAFVIIVELILAVGAGWIIGLLFAALSLKRKPRFWSVGTAALLFNLLPFIGVLAYFLRDRI